MLTTPTHRNRRLQAGALLAAFGLGLPVGMAPALAESLTAQAQIDLEASADPAVATAVTDDEADTVILKHVVVNAAATGVLALDIVGIGIADGAGGEPALPGLSLEGDLPFIEDVDPGDGAGGGEVSAEVLGLLLSRAEADLPGLGLPSVGLPGLGLPEVGVPGVGLPVGLPALGLRGLGLPGLGLPGSGLPGLGVPSLGLPGLGVPSRPDRLPSLVLPSVIDQAPSGQDDDPAVLNAGHVGPVGGLVNETDGKPGDGPIPASGTVPGYQLDGSPSQSGGSSPGSLPRTGADLRLRALAAFGLLGLAGVGGRRRRSG
jgi:hypothetical protein